MSTIWFTSTEKSLHQQAVQGVIKFFQFNLDVNCQNSVFAFLVRVLNRAVNTDILHRQAITVLDDTFVRSTYPNTDIVGVSTMSRGHYSFARLSLLLFLVPLQNLRLPSLIASHAFTSRLNTCNTHQSYSRYHRQVRTPLNSQQQEEDNGNGKSVQQHPLVMHHTAIRTRNITTAIQFYTLLGFETTAKFRAGPARAAWLEQTGEGFIGNSRLELIEIPSYILNEPDGMKKRAIDLVTKSDLLGQNHFALDVTDSIKRQDGVETLDDWIDGLNQKSLKEFGKTLRIAVKPEQRLIGTSVYELAFLYDADGALVELLSKQTDLKQNMSSGWDPWDGKGFAGSL